MPRMAISDYRIDILHFDEDDLIAIRYLKSEIEDTDEQPFMRAEKRKQKDEEEEGEKKEPKHEAEPNA